MANLSQVEKMQFEDLFDMSCGHVMHFTNQKFADFFKETISIDIYHRKYEDIGTSKANRLRSFWRQESDADVGKLLDQLLSIYEYKNNLFENNKTYKACKKTVARLTGRKYDNSDCENNFVEKKFSPPSFNKLPIEEAMISIMENRYQEAISSLTHKNSLSVIFMCGSIFEGILLGTASKNPQDFNRARSAPKGKDNKPLNFHNWKLASLIDVACELDLIGEDVKKFSHSLRDFRNYIHPYQQMSENFKPDEHTATICLKVLQATIANLSGERNT